MNNWVAFKSMNVALIMCGLFYGVLCLFSIVTGLIYASGKKKLNPLELPDSFVAKLSDENKLKQFTVKMGFVTFVVGIVQGLTSYAILRGGSKLLYWIGFSFNAFSICSVLFKLKGKINAFPLLKLIAYLAILVVLVLERKLY